MKTYKEEKTVPINALKAWKALKSMEQWLPHLKTVTKLEYGASGDFFCEGRRYKVYTPEGPVMDSVITKVDEKNYTIQIDAHYFGLKSQLTCQVIPIDEVSCKVVRIQSYPGIIGTIFTGLFSHRELNETGEYVNVWSNYALQAAD